MKKFFVCSVLAVFVLGPAIVPAQAGWWPWSWFSSDEKKNQAKEAPKAPDAPKAKKAKKAD